MQTPIQARNRLSFPKHDGQNPWLDLLRTAAIGLVLLRHGARHESAGLSEGFVANIFRNGWVGVDLFFVLSGYLIASGLIRRAGRDDGLFPAGYFRRRILRIVPAYYAVLLLCVAGFFGGPEIPLRTILAHLLFLQDYTGADINVAFWSLGVEEKFYIIAPVIVLFLARQTRMASLLAFAAMLLLVSPLSRGLTFEAMGEGIGYDAFFAVMRSPFHMSIEGFVVGIVVAILRARGFAVSQRTGLAGLGAGAAVLAAWLGSHEFLKVITRVDAWLAPTFLAVLFGAMVLCAACLSDRALRLEPFFRVNARLSYALYLVHLPLLPFASAISGERPLLFWAAYLVMSYALALVIHFAVERPFLTLKDAIRPPPATIPAKGARMLRS